MIKIDRGPPPAFFKSEQYEAMKAELWDFLADYDAKKRQSRFEFEILRYLRQGIWGELLERFHGKCAFCSPDQQVCRLRDHSRRSAKHPVQLHETI